MKKLLIILLIASFTQVKAQSFPWLHYYAAGITYAVATSHVSSGQLNTNNGTFFSFGFDPKMLVNEGADFSYKVFYRHNRFEPNIVYEAFPKLQFEALSFGCDYLIANRKLALLSGVEFAHIWNTNGDVNHRVFTIGHNTEVRYNKDKINSFSMVANARLRPELTQKNYVVSVFLRYNRKI